MQIAFYPSPGKKRAGELGLTGYLKKNKPQYITRATSNALKH
jgi:hypothetical protein